jgi:hypothetical protein
MALESNGRPRTGSAEEAPLDFLTEAEGLRDAVVDLGRRAQRLVQALRHLQKQRRVMESAWSTLKDLRLGP